MTRHFTVTLSAPGQPCGFIWVCNWCGAESETPATLHSDLVTGASAHLGTCWPYLRHEIARKYDPTVLRPSVRAQLEQRPHWAIKPR